MAVDVETRPVGPQELAAVARLFDGQRNTRHCWCTAFCSTGGQFAAGWLGGGNRRRFEALTRQSAEPMGIVARVGGEPVGWCACGPRSRYLVAGSRSSILHSRDRAEDATVWLVPCFFVRPGHRGRGLTSTLLRAAVSLARSEGAVAVEGWPSRSRGASNAAAEAFLGRETVFADLGFSRVEQPDPGRALMRLELDRL